MRDIGDKVFTYSFQVMYLREVLEKQHGPAR